MLARVSQKFRHKVQQLKIAVIPEEVLMATGIGPRDLYNSQIRYDLYRFNC